MSNEQQKHDTPAELLTPAAQAYVNMQTAAAVREAIAGLVPVLKELQLTPEKLNALKQPYQDPAIAARELRETKNSKRQEEEIRQQTAARQANCLHQDKNGKTALCLVHNFPDRQPRGVCPLCHDIINPKEWVIDSPDPVTGESKAHIREAHKDYRTVLQLEAMGV
jgi:hypothetical protein